jgi:asparagine synthase (glutamine-hydrolysing)
MLDTLSLRGPDEKTIHEEGPVLLGHTRLRVIDLATGSQPVFNEDRTVSCTTAITR